VTGEAIALLHRRWMDRYSEIEWTAPNSDFLIWPLPQSYIRGLVLHESRPGFTQEKKIGYIIYRKICFERKEIPPFCATKHVYKLSKPCACGSELSCFINTVRLQSNNGRRNASYELSLVTSASKSQLKKLLNRNKQRVAKLWIRTPPLNRCTTFAFVAPFWMQN
jgi:hypothetical protein